MAMEMAALLLLLLFAAPAVHSLQYNIPWNLGINYTTWVAGKTFTVGDNLVFVYIVDHGVDIVNQSDYASCNSGNALYSYSGGRTNITLSTPGPMYFICPTVGHCNHGMKLSIDVVAAAPKSSSATGGMFGNTNYLVTIGFSVVVACLVGFMG